MHKKETFGADITFSSPLNSTTSLQDFDQINTRPDRRVLGLALLLIASLPLAAATGGTTYRFDELSGATAIDASGAGNNGSITGASYVAGYAGSALRFRAGQLDRVVVPQSVFNGFGNTAFFEAIIRPNAYPGICGGGTAHATIFRKRAHLNDFQVVLLNDGSFGSTLYAGDGSALDLRTGPNTIPLNSWTKVGVAYDGANLILIVNGLTVATKAGQLTLDWAKNYNTTQIGNNTSDGNCDYSFSGDIDAVTISAFQKKIDEKFTQGFPDTWLPSASASVYNGVLNLNSGCVQLPGTYSRAEGLVIEADLTIMDGGIGDFNIWGLYDDLPACHNGPTNGYYTGWYPAGSDNSQDLIINRTNGPSQVLASTSARISAGALYRIKQEFLPDGTINTFINGVKTMTAKNNGRTTGFITLRSWQNVQIDNVNISISGRSSGSGRTILVTFTGGDNAPDGSSCIPILNWMPGTRVICPRIELLHPSRGMTNLIVNASRIAPSVLAKAFTFFSNGGNSCEPPPSGNYHAEAKEWVTGASGVDIQADDRLIIAGHSYGGNRARLFAEEIDTALYAKYQRHLIEALVLVDPIEWSCPLIVVALCDQRFNPPREIRAGVVRPEQVMVYRQTQDPYFRGYTVTVGGQAVPSINISLNHDLIDDAEEVQRHIVNLLYPSNPVRNPGVLIRTALVSVVKQSLLGFGYDLRIWAWNDGRLILDNVAITKATLGNVDCTPTFTKDPVLPGLFKQIDLKCFGIPLSTVRLSIEGTHNNFSFGGSARIKLP